MTLAQNKKARHDYAVLDTLEAGIALTGTEVKSCRARNVSLAESYARLFGGELYLVGAHIAQYEGGNRNNHEPRRDRKLLMHKREIRKLVQQLEAKGLTLVPLRLYLKRQKIKVELGLCRGKNVHDKREALKRKTHEQEAQLAVQQRR